MKRIRGTLVGGIVVLCLLSSGAVGAEEDRVEVRLPNLTLREGRDLITIDVDGGYWRVTPKSGFLPGLQARVFAGDRDAVRPIDETPDGQCWIYQTSVVRPLQLRAGEVEMFVPTSWLGLSKDSEIEDRKYTVIFEESTLPSGRWQLLKEHKERYFRRAFSVVVRPDVNLKERWRPRVEEAIQRGEEIYRRKHPETSASSSPQACVIVAEVVDDTVRLALAKECALGTDAGSG